MDGEPWSRILQWVRRSAQFAQVTTIGATGWPATRTMGAPLNDDWSVDLVQRATHRRLVQLRRNSRVTLCWVGSPAPGARNDSPAVFDYGWLVPRVVILRGSARFMDEAWTLDLYRCRTAELAAQGWTRAHARTDENVRHDLVGLRIRPVAVRAEGFANAAQSFTHVWRESS